MLCVYGCGNEAKFKTKAGKDICLESPYQCPKNREKNSKGVAKAHKEGRCITAFTFETRSKARKNKRYAEFGNPGKGNFKNALISERGYKCEECKLSEWMGQKIKLELEHVDANKSNNTRENLKLLCPNCHSLTSTWKRGSVKRQQEMSTVSDKILLKALLNNDSVSKALTDVGLTGSYNYNRCYKLLCAHMKGIGLPN